MRKSEKLKFNYFRGIKLIFNDVVFLIFIFFWKNGKAFKSKIYLLKKIS
jgi:hypothetical protein